MEEAATWALLIFSATIALVITGLVDRLVVSLLGVVLMIVAGVMTPGEAFSSVDWNVIAILLGMWVITQYLVEAGAPIYVINRLSEKGYDFDKFVLVIGILAGFLSIFVDNVLVILLIGTIVISTALSQRKDPTVPVVFVALSANFMGTALLLGDLPPQLLHSIAGAEFLDFLWMNGRPSSFPILTLGFILSSWAFYKVFIEKKQMELTQPPKAPAKVQDPAEELSHKFDRRLTLVVLFYFLLTIFLMSIRPLIGLPLGAITIIGATLLGVTVEILKKMGKTNAPSFEDIVEKLEWKALLFYASLFALVGGLEKSGFLETLAEDLASFVAGDPVKGFAFMYWISVPVSAVIEHDAYILTMLIVIRDLAETTGIDPWPLNWALVWGGTLGSNASVAGAPALYVAYVILKKNGIPLPARRFLKLTVTYAMLSSIFTFPLGFLIWGLLY